MGSGKSLGQSVTQQETLVQRYLGTKQTVTTQEGCICTQHEFKVSADLPL